MKRLTLQHDLPAEADTKHLAERLAAMACARDVLCLYGDLGAGKSTLARAFIRTLCGAKTEVPSPTFTLVQYYDAPDFEIVHADLYRLKDPEEIIEIGLEEYFSEAVTLIEWPQRLGRFLPAARLDITLSINPEGGRNASLVAYGQHWENRFEP